MFIARARNAFFAIFAFSALTVATPVLAHHSYAMFEKDVTRTLVGTVKAFQYTDPHGYLELLVINKSGKEQAWTVETESVLAMTRYGIKKDTFKVGDKVTLVISQLRNGTTGGALVQANLPNGAVIGPIRRPGYEPPPASR